MIIKKEIIIPEQIIPSHTKIIECVICDICKVNQGVYHCSMCGRIICKKCTIFIPNSSDYDDIYCEICYDLGKTYRELDKQLEEEYNRWSKECIKLKKLEDEKENKNNGK